MLVKLESFDSGWIGISIELNVRDIEELIKRLEDLRSRRIGHFHIRNLDFDADVGVADIELSLVDENYPRNMAVE